MKKITKSKRFWVTVGFNLILSGGGYLAMHFGMNDVATVCFGGVIASTANYQYQETSRASEKVK